LTGIGLAPCPITVARAISLEKAENDFRKFDERPVLCSLSADAIVPTQPCTKKNAETEGRAIDLHRRNPVERTTTPLPYLGAEEKNTGAAIPL